MARKITLEVEGKKISLTKEEVISLIKQAKIVERKNAEDVIRENLEKVFKAVPFAKMAKVAAVTEKEGIIYIAIRLIDEGKEERVAVVKYFISNSYCKLAKGVYPLSVLKELSKKL